MFCVECGKDAQTDDELRGGLCVECFLERNPVMVVPDVIDMIRCPTCGSSQVKGGWSQPSDSEGDDEEVMHNDVAEAAEARVQVVDGSLIQSMDMSVRQEARSAFFVNIHAEVSLMGQTVTVEESTRVRVRGEQCPICSRKAGDYYEAIIQFRGTGERPATDTELDRAHGHVKGEIQRLSASSRDVYMVKEDRVHGGLDFYISTQPAAAHIARGLAGMFSATTSSSTKLAGQRDGKEVVRVTHAVRLPELRRGDYTLFKGHLYRVLSASAKEATVDPAAGTAKRKHLSRSERQELRLVGDMDCPEDAVVVSSTGNEVQVLDPSSMRTVDLAVPSGYQLEGRETIRVVKADDQLFIVD